MYSKRTFAIFVNSLIKYSYNIYVLVIKYCIWPYLYISIVIIYQDFLSILNQNSLQ